MISESVLARLQVVVRAERGRPLPDVDAAELERQIAAAVRSWDDDLHEEAVRELGPRQGRALAAAFAGVIPESYKADTPAAAAVADLRRITQLRESGEPVAVELYQSAGHLHGAEFTESGSVDEDQGAVTETQRLWRLKIYRTRNPITLSQVLPQLQHMGVEVVDEHPYEFVPREQDRPPFWIYDFGLRGASQPGRPSKR